MESRRFHRNFKWDFADDYQFSKTALAELNATYYVSNIYVYIWVLPIMLACKHGFFSSDFFFLLRWMATKTKLEWMSKILVVWTAVSSLNSQSLIVQTCFRAEDVCFESIHQHMERFVTGNGNNVDEMGPISCIIHVA